PPGGARRGLPDGGGPAGGGGRRHAGVPRGDGGLRDRGGHLRVVGRGPEQARDGGRPRVRGPAVRDEGGHADRGELLRGHGGDAERRGVRGGEGVPGHRHHVGRAALGDLRREGVPSIGRAHV